MKIKTVIVDNDSIMSKNLENLLILYPEFEIIEQFEDINIANEYILNHDVDAVMVKLHAGNPQYSGDGSFLIFNINRYKPDLLIGAYSEDSADAYIAQNAGASVFFKMPFDAFNFQRGISRLTYLYELIRFKKDFKNRSLMVKNKRGLEMVKFSDILYIESSNRRKKMVCINGKEIEILNYTMDELVKILTGEMFYRCYQSFIVNLEKIVSIQTDSSKRNYSLILEGYDGEIILSREKYKEIIALLQERYSNLSL